MEIRPYINNDYFRLIELLRLNIPKFFDESEEKDFIEYLRDYSDNYYVARMHGELVGGGGINYFPKDLSARISWDFVHPDHHGKGIGKSLIEYRIKKIKANPDVQFIIVRTSQFAFRFYQKMGFKLEKVVADFWAKGFDLYQMKMTLRH